VSAAEVARLVMPADDARRLTERIRYSALAVRDGMEKLQTLVEEAQAGQAHVALGYKSWTAYLADTLGHEPLRLPRDQRQELVGYLAGEGMSTRAIAPIVVSTTTRWLPIRSADCRKSDSRASRGGDKP
jgi:hypothetical protein